MISVEQLLTDCIESCFLGCVQIREVRSKGISSVRSKIEGDARSALTEADVKAQAVVLGSLRKTYGVRLNVVGEEDGNEDATPKESETYSCLLQNAETVRLICNNKGEAKSVSALRKGDEVLIKISKQARHTGIAIDEDTWCER